MILRTSNDVILNFGNILTLKPLSLLLIFFLYYFAKAFSFFLMQNCCTLWLKNRSQLSRFSIAQTSAFAAALQSGRNTQTKTRFLSMDLHCRVVNFHFFPLLSIPFPSFLRRSHFVSSLLLSGVSVKPITKTQFAMRSTTAWDSTRDLPGPVNLCADRLKWDEDNHREPATSCPLPRAFQTHIHRISTAEEFSYFVCDRVLLGRSRNINRQLINPIYRSR